MPSIPAVDDLPSTKPTMPAMPAARLRRSVPTGRTDLRAYAALFAAPAIVAVLSGSVAWVMITGAALLGWVAWRLTSPGLHIHA